MTSEKSEKQGFLRGAIIISLGSFLAKVVGAISRIPLTSILGAEGVGLYQLAYPFYCLLLTLSSAGLPSGISRMVASEIKGGDSGKGVFRSAFKLFFFVGMVGTFLMFVLRNVISRMQGEDLAWCYVALCPSVVLVALLSVFRGYFQGKCDMLPTAMSDLIEQTVKGAVSCVLAWVFRANVLRAVTAVLFSVSVSEGVAVWYMYNRYRADRGAKPLYQIEQPSYKTLLSFTIPVAIAAAVLPLSQFIDSGLGVKLLKGHSSEAVALFGLYAGGAVTLVGLPVSVCYGFAVSIIPRLAGEKNSKKKVLKALGVTLLVSIPCALVLFFFARFLGGLFFRRLTMQRLDILEKLVKIMSPTAVTHASAQTLSACLIGKGQAKKAARNMAVVVAVKIVLVYLLVGNENISVYGMGIAANVCYFIAFVLNLISNLRNPKRGNFKG